MASKSTRLAIVVPCYDEEEVLEETCARLSGVVARLVAAERIAADSRIYFVDDGSRDRTWSCISDFVERGLPVVGVKLSRNRGHQNALLAGLLTAEGDALISVDADLQDDLGAIDAMIEHHRSGCDIVYGVRKCRDTDSRFKRLTANAFYRLMALMGAETVHNHADYRLLSRRAIEALKGYREVNLYLRGIIPLIGYRSATVEYDRVPRFAGTSKYPLRKMAALALNAVTSFSVVPLRLITFLGLTIFAAAMVVTAWALWVALVAHKAIPGWASVVLPMYFLGGIELLALGVIGEYLGKLYVEVKGRPRFEIERILAAGSPASQQAPASDPESQALTPAED